jgi:competence protein ComFC
MGDFVSKCSRLIKTEAGDLLDLIYPPVCGLCSLPADSGDRLVCQRCWNAVCGLEAPYCLECRQFLRNPLRCSFCGVSTLAVFSLGYFDGHLQTILHDLKFAGLKPLAGPLGRKLAQLIAGWTNIPVIDFIIPVPLHSSRKYIRGFNQAEEIAREIGLCLGIRLLTGVLRTTRKTRQQARLPAARRPANVRGAFAVDDETEILKGKTVLLVDDVTTTGATLRENARVLEEASVKRIVAAVAATAV